MLSRVADGIYWMARYLERAENSARLINVSMLAGLDWPGAAYDWAPLLEVTGARELFGERERNGREVVNFLLNDPNNPSSVLSALKQARENVRTLREILPRESWESINAVHQAASRETTSAQRRHSNLREVISGLQAMAGLFLEAMNDDAGYASLQLGRNLERADFTIRMLLIGAEQTEEDAARDGDDSAASNVPDWLGVLNALMAYQMYRRSIRGAVSQAGVALFLLHSPVFPRALSYCAAKLEAALGRFPNAQAPAAAARDFRAAIGGATPATMNLEQLRAFLHERQADLDMLHRCIEDAYFAPYDVIPQAVQSQAQVARKG